MKDQKTAFLSNWYRSPFSSDGVQYNCVEKYMMHQKAVLMNDSETAQLILQTNDPRKMKALGRKVRGWDQDLWDEHKADIATRGCRAKFTQNDDLAEMLLATGTKTLVEAAHYDKVWGIGLRATDPLATKPDQWPGQNILGKCLMQVREELQREAEGTDQS